VLAQSAKKYGSMCQKYINTTADAGQLHMLAMFAAAALLLGTADEATASTAAASMGAVNVEQVSSMQQSAFRC
jgi:hypothetical protein